MEQFGSGAYSYALVEDWGMEAKRLYPDIREVAGVTVDSEDNVYILSRVQPPIIKLDKYGTVKETFGEGVFVRPHGLFRESGGTIYGVDDAAHAVYHFDADKKLIGTLGTKGVPSDTGCKSGDKYYDVKYGGAPFNRPTRITVDKEGYLYVTDGYLNARVHKFTPDGKLVKSWGDPGDKPGEFNLPHGIGIDSCGILYVADRQNHRVQLFTTDGDLVAVWNGFHRPSDIWVDKDDIIYVAECKRTSVFDATPSRISILNADGKLLSRFGDELEYDEEIGSRCAHGLAVDSQGSLYISEVGKKLKQTFFGIRKYRRL